MGESINLRPKPAVPEGERRGRRAVLDYGLQQRQVHRLVLTPKLRQSINILQMPAAELCAFVQQQLTENPVLDIVEADGEDESSAAADQNENAADTDWYEYFADASDLGYVMDSRGSYVDQSQPYAPQIRWTPTLYDYLLAQFSLIVSDPRVARAGRCIIGSLDRDGYLRCSVEEIASACNVETEFVRLALKVIQDLEPAGIAARDLGECLSIQLRRRHMGDALRRLCIRIVTKHLDDLASMTTNQLAKVLGSDVITCELAIHTIKSLNPRPALTLDPVIDSPYVTPDVIVREIDGDFVVVMNDAAIPRVGLNATYVRLAKGESKDWRTAKYLKERLESAIWLVKSIEQRRYTIYRITECIVRRQRDFLICGPKALKPMTLRDVADDLGIHESTVCRALAGKYVQTPRGTFELSFFFQSGVANADGEGVSAAAVKRMISELISSEDPESPLSDQAITTRLHKLGIMVSRRTVAKYRDSMGIPSSMNRRRYTR